MAYKGEGEAERVEVFMGTSKESLDNALRAAVHASGVEEGTILTVSHIEIVTQGDPNIGSYRVFVRP